MLQNFFNSLYQKSRPSDEERTSHSGTVSPEVKEEAGSGTNPPIRVESMPAGIMAYMGDGIYELIVRNYFIQRRLWDSHKIHRHVIQFVNAGAQAALLRCLEPHLTGEERNMMRRARNSNAGNVPRHAKVSDYRYSTALEAVLGYTLLRGDIPRLEEFIAWIEEYLDQHVSGK